MASPNRNEAYDLDFDLDFHHNSTWEPHNFSIEKEHHDVMKVLRTIICEDAFTFPCSPNEHFLNSCGSK